FVTLSTRRLCIRATWQPANLIPQLATLVMRPPSDDAWLYEAKRDCYRIRARIESGKARLFTRNANAWTAKMPALAKEIESLDIRSDWLDGEIVVVNEEGEFQSREG